MSQSPLSDDLIGLKGHQKPPKKKMYDWRVYTGSVLLFFSAKSAMAYTHIPLDSIAFIFILAVLIYSHYRLSNRP